MEKNTIKKLLAIIMIITVLAADFCVLGTGLVAYATQVTNEIEGYPNIYFSTYFKEGENEVKQIDKSIKEEQLKLYAKIGVNSDVDCLENIQINLEDSNFNIISTDKGILEDDIVKVDYIGAGTSVEIELGIEPILSNKISADMNLETNLKLSAKYKHADAPEGEEIQASSSVSVNYKPADTTEAELETDIITNKVFDINGTNKRLVQLLIKSRLTNNEYPVKQTTLNVSIPELGEELPEVSVLALGELATNGLAQISEQDYSIVDGKLQIVLENEADENNQISWSKNVYDELVVTYIYSEDVDASKIEIITDTEIKLHSSKNTYTAQYTKGIENQEPNSVIIGRTEITTSELYKGQLYANIDSIYNTKTNLIITNENVSDKIVINENSDTFGTVESELDANTQYLSTEINKEKMLEILGESANIQIISGDTVIDTITKDKEANTDGNIVINYTTNPNEIDIVITGKTIATGILEINHTKAINGNAYPREQLQTIKTLKTENATSVTLGENKIIENAIETAYLELKETVSKAELTIDKTTLSATEINEVTVGIKLVTDDYKYDLYKNPSIELQLPEAVENVEFLEEPTKLYDDANEFGTISQSYDATNKKVVVKIDGEQKSYPQTSLYIQLKAKITLNKYVMPQTGKLVLNYKNENAIQYDCGETNVGVIEKEIEISAPVQLIKQFNVISNENISLTEDILLAVREEQTIDFEIGLINNKDTDINNIKILGKLPTTGNTITDKEENSLETTLTSITAENGEIYYTENVNATSDIEDLTNGWTQELSANAKLYLIKLDTLARGSNYTAKLSVQVPNSVEESGISYTQYEVVYDTNLEEKVTEVSRKIGLETFMFSDLTVTLTAQVGQDELNSGEKVKEGETIKYIATVKNNSGKTLENVNLKLNVPEGTSLVQPEQITTNIISKLLPGKSIEKIYEVRVNQETAGTEISNISSVMYGEYIIESNELKNIVENANIRVSVKRIEDGINPIIEGVTSAYSVLVENLSNLAVKDLKIKINSNAFSVEYIECQYGTTYHYKDESKEIVLGEIGANSTISYMVYGKIADEAKEINTAVEIIDTDGNVYRSNSVEETIGNKNASIVLASPQDGQEIKQGDIVEYNITAKNIGDIETEFVISDVISGYMSVETVEVTKGNEKIVKQTLDSSDTNTYVETIENEILEEITLKPGESVHIYIKAIVGEIAENLNGEKISNVATVQISDTVQIDSEIVTHTLKVKEELPPEEKPDDSEGEPEKPDDPNKPSDEPTDNPNEDKPSEGKNKNVVSGLAWLDLNRNGQKDNNEDVLSGIKVRIYNVLTKEYVADSITAENGQYEFKDIEKGVYIIIFEYDTEEYEPTIYMADGVDTTINSKAILNNISFNGQEIIVAVTDTINVEEDVYNINLGLKEKLMFDLELEKYITRIVVQNKKGTKAYDYNQKTLAKVEIHRKQIEGTLVVIEYTIKVKNNGELAGYVKNIVDYLPSGMTFSSELNKDWYLSENYLYTKCLENVELKPGEEKEIKLILTKTMTGDNVGLINNRAEIYQHYNQYGNIDIDSTPNNQAQAEDDIGVADAIIAVATGGGTAYTILLLINILLIGIAIKMMVKNEIIKIKRGRR